MDQDLFDKLLKNIKPKTAGAIGGAFIAPLLAEQLYKNTPIMNLLSIPVGAILGAKIMEYMANEQTP